MERFFLPLVSISCVLVALPKNRNGQMLVISNTYIGWLSLLSQDRNYMPEVSGPKLGFVCFGRRGPSASRH